MPLSNGVHIGSYEIVDLLGSGGMGEVYRARDLTLKRDVALKVLPDAFSHDRERIARLRREAQVLAALNHPNIAAIYELEESGDITALVMEVVESETLMGALPIETVLNYARQIADALEAAHEKGIIHRDLKPGNIKVTPAGVVKVLDFGLATIAQSGETKDGADPQNSPTLTLTLGTQAGIIMGTAAYMSPEQAAGKPVDKRTDIWSYGVVLFEMLTGRRLFEGGETISHTLADVLRAPIDFSKLPADTPTPIRDLLRRCLDRDVKNRLRDIGEARVAIDKARTTPGVPATAPSGRISSAPWIMTAIAMVIVASIAGLGWWRATRPIDRPLMRFTDDLGGEIDGTSAFGPAIAISPDGLRLAYVSTTSDAKSHMFLRLIGSSKSTPLSGAEGAPANAPFFSPDGRWIGFFSDTKLKKISVEGGAAVTLCDVGSNQPRGGFWGEDGNILFAGQRTPLMRVNSSGGTPVSATEFGNGEVTNRFAQLLPGGEAFLFTASRDNNVWEDATVQAQIIKTGQRKTLLTGGYFGRYIGTTGGAGYLLYVHEGTVFAAPMDLKRLELTGPASPVLEDVSGRAGNGFAQLDLTLSGTLVYIAGLNRRDQRSLAFVDASGNVQTLPATPAEYQAPPRPSLDGARIAVRVASGPGTNLSVYDWATNRMTRLTFIKGIVGTTTWTPDGKHIVFQIIANDSPGPGIYWMRADGASEPQLLLEGAHQPYSFSPDGNRLAFSNPTPAEEFGIWTLPLDLSDPEHPKAGKPEPFLPSKFRVGTPEFSPDGRWIAYTSLESQTPEVFVRPFGTTSSAPGGKWQISTDQGQDPYWSRNTSELFFLRQDGPRVVSYTVSKDSFSASQPRLWSQKLTPHDGAFSMMPDGKRFIAVLPPSDGAALRPTHVTFLLSFSDELRRRAATGK